MSTFIRIALTGALLFKALSAPAQQYPDLGRHARQAPDSLRYSLSQLVDYLSAPARTEQEKAFSLYTWLTHTITYDEEASRQGRRINQSFEDILRRSKGICFDYALLYAELCRRAGLRCVPISGYSRQGLEAMELPPTPDHAWNAIFLDGEWQLADPTWGAFPGQDAFSLRYGVGYFLTPPQLFILNHLPALPMWQLLPCPVTAEQFSRPAESLSTLIERASPCYHYSDTIQAFLQLTEEEQRREEAEHTYRFHSTEDNQKAWAQAIIDYAVHLSEQGATFQEADSLEAFLELQQEAIRLTRKAGELTPLLPWQIEFFTGLLINQAVALNQQSDKVETPQRELALLKDAQQYLESARKALLSLPEDNYYRQYAEQQCQAYQEVIQYNIERLE